MKNLIISAISMAIVLVSCNQKSKEGETTNPSMMENDATMSVKDTTMMVTDTTMTKDSKTKLCLSDASRSSGEIKRQMPQMRNGFDRGS